MFMNRKIKKRFYVMLLISIVLLTGMFGSLLNNFSNSSSNLNNIDNFDNEIIKKKEPLASVYGTHSWWDKNYHSRQVINITNPYSESLKNFGVSISFNYTTQVEAGNMNDTLKDLRIIEYDGSGNPYQRKYYFQMNYPDPDIATVWFDTNISGFATELDTYLYYGNDATGINTTYFMNETTLDSVSNNFGWVRNGNFEQDPGAGGHAIDGVFGWYYADDIPLDVKDPHTPDVPDPVNYQHNLSIIAQNQELMDEGTYTFKFGDIGHDVSSGSSGKDLSGTLFSAPFVVPTISGGSNKIYLNAWRNFRTYDNQNSKKIGVYVRIASTYGIDVTLHTAYGGTVYTQGYIEYWDSHASESTLKTWVTDPYGILPDKNTAAGQLTGDLLIDVSDYQGEAIFLEFGMLDYNGENAGKFNAFTQVDNVTFTYDLEVSLDSDVERRKSDVSIIVRDIDGRIVPNAEVSLINSTAPLGEQRKYGPINSSTDEGIALFTGVVYKNYNVTVNYTIPNTDYETVVYNSSVNGLGYEITEAQHTFTIYVDIWTIDFEMVDYDKEPLNYGYVAVYNNTKGDTNLVNLTLDTDGKATFRWKNQSSYYYEAYYDNSDYNLNPTLLNESWIKRENYDQIDNKYRLHSFFVNQTNTDPKGNPTYAINELFYTNGSVTELGNKKILDANINITFQSSSAYLTEVSIYYIDKNNSTDDNYLIYYNSSYDADFLTNRINIDMREPLITPSSLITNNYEVYGLKIVAIGANTTNNNAIFNISLTETTNIYNITDLVKLNVKIVDTYDVGISAAFVKVNSTVGRAAGFNVTLKTDGTGYAFGQGNTDLPFWFLRGSTYNFSLNFLGDHVDVNVTESDQWKDFTAFYYNYTLMSKTNITLKLFFGLGVILNLSKYQTAFKDLDVVDQVMWGENVTVSVNFTKTDDDWASPSLPVIVPTTINYTVRSTGIGAKNYFTLSMTPGAGAGIYTATFNANQLSAGIKGGEVYSITVSGTKDSYIDPSDISDTIYVEAVPTVLSMHNYDNPSIEITEISEVFGESINLTVKYYNNSITPFTDAILTYEWLSLVPIQFFEDPMNAGYYTTSLDTSIAEVWGLRSIIVKAIRENYTTQTFLTSLSITERTTSLNGESDLVYISSKVWVEDPNPFEFIYKDTFTSSKIANLTSATYSWEQLYANGTRIPGVHGTGTLTQNVDISHVLDFKTEIKEIGNYYLYITLHKQNYKLKTALINLEILSREFSYDLQPGKIVGGIMEIENGDALELSMTLDDLTRNISLQGATVSMSFQSTNYNFTEVVNGTYSIDIDDYTLLDADATSETTTTNIIISKANFTTQIIDVTILLNNRRFDYTFTEEFVDNLVSVISGNRLTFDVTLENANDESFITDAVVTLTINNQTYNNLEITNNEDGTYTFNFLSYPTAFTASNTLSGEITIQSTNYKTETIPITIQISMEEIFPGVPTFYFILITAAVIGIVGSIVAYRVIQQARIPKHVKKIRKVKSLIKSKKKIADIASVPSKNEMFAKIFGNDWKAIGLEIGDSLGLKDLKAKKMSLKEKEPKDKIKKIKAPKEKKIKDKPSKGKIEKKKSIPTKVTEEKTVEEKTSETEKKEKGEGD